MLSLLRLSPFCILRLTAARGGLATVALAVPETGRFHRFTPAAGKAPDRGFHLDSPVGLLRREGRRDDRKRLFVEAPICCSSSSEIIIRIFLY